MVKAISILEATSEYLIVKIPRKAIPSLYEKRGTMSVAEVSLSLSQKRAIVKSEKELAKGEYVTLNELAYGLGGSRAKARK